MCWNRDEGSLFWKVSAVLSDSVRVGSFGKTSDAQVNQCGLAVSTCEAPLVCQQRVDMLRGRFAWMFEDVEGFGIGIYGILIMFPISMPR